MKIITRATAIKNLKPCIGKDLRSLAKQYGITTFETGKQNKGWKGLVLERLAGLQTNVSKAPNGLDFELKSVSFYHTKNGLGPKETMAITMINQKELETHSFFKSHVWTKLKSIVFCAVAWHGENSPTAELLSVACLDFAKDGDFIKELEADYDLIRHNFITKGGFKSEYGKWIQARTKGQGGINPRTGKKRPKTRAFYARTQFVKKIFETAS